MFLRNIERMDRVRADGFTIIELMVAMTVFLVVVGISSGIFTRTIRTQRIVTDMSASLNNVTLALEQIAREARTGYFFTLGSDLDMLSFTNVWGESVEYTLDQEGRIVRTVLGGESQLITSAGTNISQLRFKVAKKMDGGSALITIATTASGEGDIDIHLQTSVSSRIVGF